MNMNLHKNSNAIDNIILIIILMATAFGFGQNITIAEDDADNYDPPAWNNTNNQGTGFDSWIFDISTPNGGSAGRFIGSFSSALDTNGKSFALFANSANDATSGATRPFIKTLEDGDTLVLSVGVNFRDGAKGFDLRDSSDNTVINFNVGNNEYELNGTDLFSNNYDANTVITFTFSQNSGDVTWEAVRSGGLTGTKTGTIANISPGTIENVRFYNVSAGTNSDGGGARNMFFNNLKITSPYELPPTNNSPNLSYASVEATSMDINWSNGNGTDRIVVLRESNPVNFTPDNGSSYTANSDFSAGTGLGPNSDNKVVYNGSGNSVTVTGLSLGTTYHVAVYEYNGSGGTESYATSSNLTGSQTTSDIYKTVASGTVNYGNTASWEVGAVPPAGAKIEILTDVTLNQDATVSEVTINSGSTLISESGQSRTLSIEDGGSFTNNGTFTANDGTVSFSGGATISGTTTFKDVDIAGGVDFGSGNTIDGNLTIESGGFVDTNPPTYSGNSTLIYSDNGNTYGRSTEWSASSGAGYPNNVIIQDNTTLDLGANGGAGTAREIAGNLTVSSGSTLSLDDTPMTAALTVKGNFTNDGTVELSGSSGGDLILEGDFDDNGTFTANGRAVFFEGGNTQNINSNSDPLEIDVMRIDKSGGEVVMDANLLADETPDPLQFSNATSFLNLNGFDLTLGKDGVVSSVTYNGGSFRGNVSSNLTIEGDGAFGDLIFDTSQTQNILNNLIVDRTGFGSVSIGTNLIINNIKLPNGNLDLNGNTLAISGDIRPEDGSGLIEGSIAGSTLVFDDSSTARTLESGDLASNTITNLTLDESGGVSVNTDLTVTGTFDINAGENLIQAGKTLKIDGNITNDGNITFKSELDDSSTPASSKTAQLDEFTGNITGTGDVTVERFIPAGDNSLRAFRFLSTAVNSNGTIFANWQQGGLNSGDTGYEPGFGTHITGAQGTVGNISSDGFDETGSGNPSLLVFDNTFSPNSDGWSPIDNTNSTNLEAGHAYNLFVRGDRSVDLSLNSDAQNPTNTRLRSTGDLVTGSLVTGSELPSLASGADEWSFIGNPYQAIVNFNDLTFTDDIKDTFFVIWDPNAGNNQGSYETIDSQSTTPQMIQPGQSFFVQNSGTVSNAPTIEFTESAKNTSGTVTSVFNTNNVAVANLELYDTNDTKLDVMKFRFEAGADNGLDDYDAGKLGNPTENLASVNGSTLLSIERRAIPSATDTIPLFINQYQFTDYEFQLNTSNWDDSIDVYLKDDYLDEVTPLEADDTFSFTVDANIPESIATDRFSLIFENTTLGVDNNESAKQINLYPNPSEGQFTIQTQYINTDRVITIYDMSGKQVFRQSYPASSNGELNVNAGDLSVGVYMVEMNNANKETYTTRLIIK